MDVFWCRNVFHACRYCRLAKTTKFISGQYKKPKQSKHQGDFVFMFSRVMPSAQWSKNTTVPELPHFQFLSCVFNLGSYRDIILWQPPLLAPQIHENKQYWACLTLRRYSSYLLWICCQLILLIIDTNILYILLATCARTIVAVRLCMGLWLMCTLLEHVTLGPLICDEFKKNLHA